MAAEASFVQRGYSVHGECVYMEALQGDKMTKPSNTKKMFVPAVKRWVNLFLLDG